MRPGNREVCRPLPAWVESRGPGFEARSADKGTFVRGIFRFMISQCGHMPCIMAL